MKDQKLSITVLREKSHQQHVLQKIAVKNVRTNQKIRKQVKMDNFR